MTDSVSLATTQSSIRCWSRARIGRVFGLVFKRRQLSSARIRSSLAGAALTAGAWCGHIISTLQAWLHGDSGGIAFTFPRNPHSVC